MNRKQILASFQVHVTDVQDGTWKGYVEVDHITYHFQSELQLLRWLMEQFPVLSPEPAQDSNLGFEHKEV